MNIIQTIKQAINPNAIVPSENANSSSFILSKEEFTAFQEAFKTRANLKQTSAADILLYNIVRDKDLHRGFTPVTNPKKLAGGESAYNGDRRFIESKREIRWATEGFSKGHLPGAIVKYYNLTPEQCAKIVEALK